MAYFDCYLIPIRREKLAGYEQFSRQIAAVYREFGAIRVVDCLLDDATADGTQFHADGAQNGVQDQDLRDFPIAAAAETGETVILSITEWPSKDFRDEHLPRVLADPRVQPVEGQEVYFEGRRLVSGGFFGFIDSE